MLKKILQLVISNQAIVDDADYYTFLLSLAPVPGLQQVGQILNRITSNQILKLKFEELKKEIFSGMKSELKDVTEKLERVRAIAVHTNDNDELKSKIKSLLEEVLNEEKEENSEFIVDTENWSFQALINNIIEADVVAINANNNSQNLIKDTKIKSKKTHLKATNNSQNIIENGEFRDGNKAVSMKGIMQEGYINVTGNSVGFGPGGKLIFGRPPQTVNGNCPKCGTNIKVAKNLLYGKTHIQCPTCLLSLPFTIN